MNLFSRLSFQLWERGESIFSIEFSALRDVNLLSHLSFQLWERGESIFSLEFSALRERWIYCLTWVFSFEREVNLFSRLSFQLWEMWIYCLTWVFSFENERFVSFLHEYLPLGELWVWMSQLCNRSERQREYLIQLFDERIIADVTESIAETQPISINRIQNLETQPISINRIQNLESINRQNIQTYTRSLEETRNELFCRECASMTYNIWSKDVEAENREIYLYSGSKSKSEVWRYFDFYRKEAGSPAKNTYSQHYKSNLSTTMSSVRHVVLFVFDLQQFYSVSDVMWCFISRNLYYIHSWWEILFTPVCIQGFFLSILWPKFGYIPNGKSYLFFPKIFVQNSQFQR